MKIVILVFLSLSINKCIIGNDKINYKNLRTNVFQVIDLNKEFDRGVHNRIFFHIKYQGREETIAMNYFTPLSFQNRQILIDTRYISCLSRIAAV